MHGTVLLLCHLRNSSMFHCKASNTQIPTESYRGSSDVRDNILYEGLEKSRILINSQSQDNKEGKNIVSSEDPVRG